ncbi:zinc metallochaperone AztD [Bradyrhizobium sp. LMTR 3]|uniref:zinc metallochaperone AztD n=1 Tax=Bradyrhizobium sp. LMTR 3 TaxID=189873 RepID=UPI0008109F93|nr:zinc metallochaperone AztD [Bradyrhizobium sp. LMTR 3]OCK54965.1 hypothetical protein LMTR3_09280 [Bradyrhizobium sp. LMTR 3]
MTRVQTGGTVILLTTLALTCAALAGEKTAWRLFVSDHSESIVNVIDLLKHEKIEAFATKAPARLYRSKTGRTVLAVQRGADLVTAIDSGISFEDHGDHGDLKVKPPRLLGVEIAGKQPSHVVEHGGEIAIFFDGEGRARIASERTIQESKPVLRKTAPGLPHHGVAVTNDRYTLISEPNAQNSGELPIGISIVDKSGAQIGGVHSCPDLHGEATSGNILAFSCASGLLVVSMDVSTPQIKHLPYAAALPSGKTTTMLGGRGLQYFLGNYGSDKVVLIDPAEAESFRLVTLPMRRVDFAVDPVRAKFAYVFTEDGRLHRLDVIAGEIDGSLRVTEPYSMDGHWNDPRPRLAVAGDKIVVTDPSRGVVSLVDATSLTKTGEIALGGRPFNIVAVGGSGQTHDDE